MKTILFATLFCLSLCSCSLVSTSTDALVITADTVDVSAKVDAIQAKIGAYSANEETLIALDEVQKDILLAMQGDISRTKVTDLYSRCMVIYIKINTEIAERWAEIPVAQQESLTELDASLVLLNEKIIAFLENDSNADLLEFSKNVLDTTFYCAQILETVSTIKGM